MDRFRDFIDANEYGNSPVESVIDVSSIAQEDPLNDADASMTELLTEINVRSLAPAIAIGYILKDYNKSKSILARAKSAKTIEDRLREINEMLIINSRQNLVLGALMYALHKGK
tara:strand:+ start:110 stop:451 length:342 start_codon:yes stop_codon:yes gene_type:complete